MYMLSDSEIRYALYSKYALGPPYGVSLSWFRFINPVIVLLLLSSFNVSAHVLLLLSRLA